MPTSSVELPARFAMPGAFRAWPVGLLAAGAWLALGLFTANWPNAIREWPLTQALAGACVVIAGLLTLAALAWQYWRGNWPALHRAGPWLLATPVLLGVWQLLTAKLAWLPVPFFAPPQALLEVYLEDWQRLGESLWASLALLFTGVAIGAVCGFVAGVAIGWSRAIGYWLHPLLRLLGPIPSTALLPLCFFLFPSSWSASVFLIALATWFPVTVLTWSGVAGVDRAYYDVARTLGASQSFLILRVAIPAALPQVFVGLFMGLGASFSVLVVAEMIGVKAGIGFYLQWAQGWAAYANMYAALLLMALLCSGLISGLFLLRDRLLAWQKGTVQW